MAIEKSMYPVKAGMPAMDDIDLEMDDEMDNLPTSTEEFEDGSVEITIGEIEDDGVETAPFGANLAEYLEETTLNVLSSDLVALVDADVVSRKDWADTFAKGMEVLGFRYEERSEPWEDACGVYSTVLAEAAIRFQAETMSETFPAAGPVRTKILGEEDKEKEEAAARVKADMNYELTEVMVEYRSEHERMLYSLGLAGSAFKKVYFDPLIGRQTAVYLSAEDVIVPWGASNIQFAERVTHLMRKTKNEMAKMQGSGFYRDVDLGEPVTSYTDIEEKKAKESGFSLTQDDRYHLYEIHTELVLEGIDEEEGDIDIAKPYIVTLDKSSGGVLSIYRNWAEEDPLMLKRNHFVHYVYVPGFGFYGLGLIHIIGGYARAGTSLIRQLVDAGTLSNLPGGLKSRGLRVKGDDTPIAPGEWRDVDVPSGSIRDNVMPLPYKEPSQTLLLLLDKITEEGRRLGAISDMNISDMSANAPVGTTLALLERTLKPMAAVQARVHYAMKLEFKLLKEIIADYAPTDYKYVPERGTQRARQADYAMVEVIPVSDPNSSTMAQRIVQYQTALQMAQGTPQIYDLAYLHRQMIEVLGIKNADRIVPTKDDIKPSDPVSENMAALVGKPMKAFIYQDHEAHMATHAAFLQDPQIMQTVGQNPMAQQIMGSLQAHMAEHMAYLYRKQMEEKLGVALPNPEEELDEQSEQLLSRLLADAGRQVSQANQQKAAQMEAQKQAQDPLMQLQQKEVQIKEAEVQRKAKRDADDLMVSKGKLLLDKQKADTSAATAGAQIESNATQANKRLQVDVAKTLLTLGKGAGQQGPNNPATGSKE